MIQTELMRKILTSEMGQKMLSEVSPRYGNAYVVLWLFQVMGLEMDKAMEWTETFQDQVVPQTATWTIEYWERQYGIASDSSLTIEQRRQNVVNILTGKQPMTPYRLKNIAEAETGFDCRVEENTGVNTFSLYINALPEDVDEEALAATIKKAKPARLVCNIIFENAVEQATTYVATAIQQSKTITLQQR